ncbi:HD domain-containing phosphohydrolase [Halarcobacter sp.]|uniref:HD-GYP domain-containing protein n=1 Tax=Halarcobacter sp. TaxID=2321133 RepID=UPI0029F587C1|nr:HD domain-containing phosphohydrolase [Halarcobacter sp.]
MDKKRQIQFNLNNFLLALSYPLDAIENHYYNTDLIHSKKIAFIALKLAKEFNYEEKYLSDICSYSLIHNIALKQTNKKGKEYCLLGEEYIKSFPFLTNEEDIIKYHCEHYDGSGTFGLKGDEIPLFSQFIAFVDIIDTQFNLSTKDISNREKIIDFVKKNELVLFSSDIVECFMEFSEVESFWLDLQNEQEMLTFIFSSLFDYTQALDFEQILSMTTIFYKMMDGESNLLENCEKVADFYNFDHKDKQTFLIAASLTNIGKFFVPQKLVEKSTVLEPNEHKKIKAYPYYTNKTLSNVIGFADINTWASRIQEFVDGSGYPYCLESKDLSLKDRLLCVINIYSSLTSQKKYRDAFSKDEAIKVLESFAHNGKIDKAIAKDFNKIFL